jgi:hypothetical protein
LGAILSGDRHAAGVGNQLKNFDVDTRYGSKAMSQLYTVLSDPRKSVPYSIPLPEVDKEKSRRQRRTFHEFAADNMSAVELASKDSHGGKIQKPHLKNMSVSRFLNRILGLPVNDQSLLFQFFQEILEVRRFSAMRVCYAAVTITLFHWCAGYRAGDKEQRPVRQRNHHFAGKQYHS